MTFANIFRILVEYRSIVLLGILAAPWLAWFLCRLFPGKRAEKLILNLNLGLAFFGFGLSLAYLLFAKSNGGWARVTREADILLCLSPLYYVGVSLWLTRQRVSLGELSAIRVAQGLGMIGTAYVFLSWIAGKISIILFSYIPFPLLLLFALAMIGLAYWGFLRVFGLESPRSRSPERSSPDPSADRDPNRDIDAELHRLRQQVQGDLSKGKNKPEP